MDIEKKKRIEVWKQLKENDSGVKSRQQKAQRARVWVRMKEKTKTNEQRTDVASKEEFAPTKDFQTLIIIWIFKDPAETKVRSKIA